MASKTLTKPDVVAPTFPAEEVRRRLRQEAEEAAEESSVFSAEWEPLLDSLRMVSAVQTLEDLFPRMKLPPDKLVRKGGYWTVDEAVEDMFNRIHHYWTSRTQPKGRP
jgi:hypothetical protein